MIPGDTKENESRLLAGIDVGSTTTKIVVIDAVNGQTVYFDYKRHYSAQLQSACEMLSDLEEKIPGSKISLIMTGSGAKPIADYLHIPFIQEVVANATALQNRKQQVRTAIELGGQDAKIIFFGRENTKDQFQIKDMRMNGSCAGGTGAFIDEIASVLNISVEEFNALAEKGTCVYDISGRCGVYAKTDIQPLLNQGASKEDIALSAFHAIAKQTIGGLAQGLEIEKPVAFEGGPLTFNPVLIRVFAERLQLQEKDIVVPEHPEMMVAYGAAYSLQFRSGIREMETQQFIHLLNEKKQQLGKGQENTAYAFFDSKEEAEAFYKRHTPSVPVASCKRKGRKIRKKEVYLGIDSGSTTTKFVLMNEKEEIVDYFYAPNEGEPLEVAKNALIAIYTKYQKAGIELDILAAGVTGYGEMLFNKAFRTEYHMVETVAHAKAAQKYVNDATFILDIGGQDMKAIWLDHGVITNIVVNEACSSGCGSFLENFAASLDIPAEKIAEAAFSSKNPAVLGSRCTVFMNSSIITEQRNGKKAEDIMAGLCRSIIENVFTKVIRISNLDSLGERIVVQGGTFENDAVLRAMEQYVGREVVRAPYPGLMGAIGAALLTKEHYQEEKKDRTFIGWKELETFSYHQETNMLCPFCTNHCKRTIVRFSNGDSWVTNNRCERGEIIGNPEDTYVKEQLKQKYEDAAVPDLFSTREKLLFKEYPYPAIEENKNIVIGIPRVLSYWETMPFWKVFWKSLGYDVLISPKSTRKIYESGLAAVTSDTVCFPAKLVHGHIRSLVECCADRIFMPSITTVESENLEKTSESMCAVVKGYPIVLRNSDNPEEKWGIPFDAPLFHWHSNEDRNCQLKKYMLETFHIQEEHTELAIRAADEAQEQFHRELKQAGAEVIEEVKKKGTFAIVLAARPYQNDSLVNHGLSQIFTKLGIPVLTVDSLPDVEKVDLSNSRIDIVNNYHARMLSGAVMVAEKEYLEYVQVVSFGCGHDAYLSDEIIRMMKEVSGKTPLILKVDESDITGPLSIRVRSFIETVAMRRKDEKPQEIGKLQDAYPVKFTKECVKEKVVLVPNTSHAFSRVMSAAMISQHIRAVPLEIGRERAIYLGKKYVHNDICFPAQIVIGEVLAALESGQYDDKEVAVAMAKYIGDCRLTHYTALLRKALDDAGYAHIPILTNDDKDTHHIHPGFKMNLKSSIGIAATLPMIDILEELLRKIRPYETIPGSTEEAFEKAMDEVITGLQKHWVPGAKNGFKKAIRIMNEVSYNRSELRPTVLIVGEYLLNFHPGANHDIEKYLEDNGFEIIEARMTDVIRKTYFYQDAQVKEYKVQKPLLEKLWLNITNMVFDQAHSRADSVAKVHPLYKPVCRMDELVKDSDPIIHHTFDAGEGVLIPGEIIHHAKNGCKSFVILQPFGCLPNHVVGRGIIKRLKELYPDVQILPLDYDPDVSFANIENRLQMLIMNAFQKKIE